MNSGERGQKERWSSTHMGGQKDTFKDMKEDSQRDSWCVLSHLVCNALLWVLGGSPRKKGPVDSGCSQLLV